MSKFQFPLISLKEIEQSPDGSIMTTCIKYNYSHGNIFISGCAGSGKTTVALHRLSKCLDKPGYKVGLFCYGNLLKTYMSNISGAAGGHINSFCQWVSRSEYERCEANELPFDKETAKKVCKSWSEQRVEDFFSRIAAAKGSYDEIIIDEGQDLPPHIHRHWSKLSKRVMVLADDTQILFPEQCSYIEEIRDALGDHFYQYLDRNYRNTPEIFSFASLLLLENQRVGQLASGCFKSTDPDSKPVVYTGYDDEMDLIKGIIDENRGSSIGIILKLQKDVDNFYERLTAEKIDCCRYHSGLSREDKFGSEGFKPVLVTTYKSLKGLEFDVIVLPRIDRRSIFGQEEESRNELYVACTRASKRLHLLLGEDPPEFIRRWIDDANIKENCIIQSPEDGKVGETTDEDYDSII